MDIGGNSASDHGIESNNQSNLYACLSKCLGHAERGAGSKGMPDQDYRVYSPAFAVLKCFGRQSRRERVIGYGRANISFAKFFRQLIDAGRQDICKPAQQVNLLASRYTMERLGKT